MGILTLLFAILLCLINAVMWLIVSDQPIVAGGWIIAAGACFWLQRWTRG